ncbi:A/G-specific adenine glycosylase [Solitalea lacus]|uniref:A/G-specific adenine glycosylase n=1 Tax=Solitalea lacus TaxID=2911172 RepID=UPI001EDB5403|nr:A/G-specific adenine glycosylase [Solitalea lacus]UKJ07580.1 A/G-specific adenine glycosylase [Solitalea lacus]
MFVEEVTKWYKINKRDLPWRNTQDAYVIWLSEVILQQTRVEQGLPYFHKFHERFNTVTELAQASEDEVLKLWQGLGYYSRARNMHATAKIVIEQYNGVFPTQYEQLIKLKGVGEYTAAAISSFSANERHAVVDGNVYRLLSRHFGIETPIDSSAGKKQFKELAYELLLYAEPTVYNQAIMEFGARQCKPVAPNCGDCPLKLTCVAYKEQKISELPVKAKKIVTKSRYFNYLIFRQDDGVLLKKRLGKDIWQNMYDFPLIESSRSLSEEEILKDNFFQRIFPGKSFRIMSVSDEKKHVLSHQVIYARFWEMEAIGYRIDSFENGCWVAGEMMENYAVPKLVDNYLKKF